MINKLELKKLNLEQFFFFMYCGGEVSDHWLLRSSLCNHRPETSACPVTVLNEFLPSLLSVSLGADDPLFNLHLKQMGGQILSL